MDGYVPQSVSNLVWAYATLGVQPGEEFCAAVCAHMGAHLGNYGSQHIANTMWSLSVLDYRDEATLRGVAGELVHLEDFWCSGEDFWCSGRSVLSTLLPCRFEKPYHYHSID